MGGIGTLRRLPFGEIIKSSWKDERWLFLMVFKSGFRSFWINNDV